MQCPQRARWREAQALDPDYIDAVLDAEDREREAALARGERFELPEWRPSRTDVDVDTLLLARLVNLTAGLLAKQGEDVPDEIAHFPMPIDPAAEAREQRTERRAKTDAMETARQFAAFIKPPTQP